eukprot:scaffold3424_cov256-Pinguiococcus_pyrenoidosus.AAC.5
MSEALLLPSRAVRTRKGHGESVQGTTWRRATRAAPQNWHASGARFSFGWNYVMVGTTSWLELRHGWNYVMVELIMAAVAALPPLASMGRVVSQLPTRFTRHFRCKGELASKATQPISVMLQASHDATKRSPIVLHLARVFQGSRDCQRSWARGRLRSSGTPSPCRSPSKPKPRSHRRQERRYRGSSLIALDTWSACLATKA